MHILVLQLFILFKWGRCHCRHAIALPQTPSHKKRPRRKKGGANRPPVAPDVQFDEENKVREIYIKNNYKQTYKMYIF